jgi:hypothetical protein
VPWKKTICSTSSIVRYGIVIAARCDLKPSFSISTGSGGKNADSSSSACSTLSFVLDPLPLVNGGILSNAEFLSGSRSFAACQIFASSARKASQCASFCLRIAS